MNMKQLVQIVTLLILMACGTKNAFDCDGGVAKSQCSQRTKYENARIALDDGDLDTAITLLDELITDEPSNYERYPLLAAAYAARAGLDILNIVTSNFGGSSSMLQTLSSVIPTPAALGSAYDQSLVDMNAANEVLEAIPAELRSSTSSDKYAASAVLQMTLYQSAYAVMYLNKFTYSASGYDPSRLSSMTADDATAILSALAAAGAASGGAAGSAAQEAIAAIQAQPGATDAEKLAAWSQSAR
jgi:hypothetical protein